MQNWCTPPGQRYFISKPSTSAAPFQPEIIPSRPTKRNLADCPFERIKSTVLPLETVPGRQTSCWTSRRWNIDRTQYLDAFTIVHYTYTCAGELTHGVPVTQNEIPQGI